MSYPTNADPFAGHYPSPSVGFGAYPSAPHQAPPAINTAHPMTMPPTYGYPPTGQPAAPQAPKRRRKGLLIGGVAAAATATLVVAGILAWFLLGANGEEDQIRAAMGSFNTAVENGDVDAVASHLCAQEAAAFKGLHIPVPPASGAPQPNTQVGLSNIQIKGQLAAATLTAAGKPDTTLYFRKEADNWKLCASAQQDFTAAA